MQQKPRYLTGAIYLIALAVILSGLLLPGCSGQDPADTSTSDTKGPSSSESETEPDSEPAWVTVFNQYRAAWLNQDYAAMYSLLTDEARTRIDQETFITRYQNIFSGIQADEMDILLLDAHHERPLQANEQAVSFQVNMQTLAGYLQLTEYEMVLVQTAEEPASPWRIEWNESLIFPHMEANDKVQARILHPRRGEIRDRYSRALAVNDDLISIGIVPGRFLPVREEAVPQMAEWLGISEDRINQVVDQATVVDWFYPVVTLAGDQTDLSARLTSLDGVQFQRKEGRVYPGGAAAGLLVGYMGPITAEELERYPDADYTAHDQIGKMGLELAFESRLRGSRGGEIYLVDKDTNRIVREIARQEPVHGENIRLTIDLNAQLAIYQEMQENAGSAAAIDPRTGEILALVSTPSFDPNLFQTYIPDETRRQWNEADKSYFLNRFNAGYIPGSVFKFVTSAIGLKAGTLIPDEVLPISGLRWQPDNSWGTYRITRVRDSGPVDFRAAMVTSDNIYFAMQALRIGRERFEQEAAVFALGESLPISLPFYRSQLSNEGLSRQTLIADTGYGQGEILVSTLHMAMIYGTLASQGHMMQPVFEWMENLQPVIWKEQAVRTEDVDIMRQVLRQVISDPSGSGYTQTPTVRELLGKTGTAELKAFIDDEDAEENGWFIAMDAEQNSLVLAMMIEDVKDRGGSRYVVPLVKRAMDSIISAENE